MNRKSLLVYVSVLLAGIAAALLLASTATERAEMLRTVPVGLAALVAIYGIDAWRRELRGKKQVELAEEVLALFYEAKDVISAIRSVVGYMGEGKTRKRGPNEKPEDSEALDSAYVVFERYQGRQELFNRIHALRYRFRVHFGDEAAAPFEELSRIVNKLLTASHMLGVLWTMRRPSDPTPE